MSKFVKVVKVIFLVLAIIVGVAFVVGYIWFKDNTIEIVESLKGFLNQPLPIVGVSILTASVFVYEIVVKVGYGKTTIKSIISEKDSELAKLQEKELQVKEIAQDTEQKLVEQAKEIEQLKDYIIELCGYSRNLNAKQLIEKIKGDIDNGEQSEIGQATKE